MLKPPYPSSPTRNPIEHLYFSAYHNNEQLFLITQGFSALYAAKYWLDQFPEAKWKSTDTLTITRGEYRLEIRGSQLENVIEYTPTKEEAAWTPADPQRSYLRRITMFGEPPQSQPIEQPEPKPISAPKRHKSQKSVPGQITVAQIAEELNIAPNKARNILRKGNISKPSSGWSFSPSDPMVETIRRLLSSSS